MPTGARSAEFSGLLVNPLYAAMPAQTRAAIEARGHVRRLVAGEQLFSKGDPSDGAYALLSGQVEYSTLSPSGRHSIVNIVELGKWLGDISTIDGAGRTMDCWALTDATLMHLAARDFLTLVEAHSAFARMLILIQGQRVREALSWIEALTKLGAEGRLAERLLIFARSRGHEVEDGIRLELQLTQEVIAELIGTTRQRVNQVLNQWQNDGLIRLDDRHIVILDEAGLRDYVDLA